MPRFSPTLLDHANSPRNAGKMADAHLVGCADLGGRPPEVRLFIKIEAEMVVAASFLAYGCGVTIAAMSMLTVLVTGRRLNGCQELQRSELIDVLGGVPGDKQFCADLAIQSLRDALEPNK